MNAIETTYNGVTFRSRLEARWAVLFDVIGWSWTYEPFDVRGYIPDFLINGERPMLVEVKPAATIPDLLAHVNRLKDALRDWNHDVLLVGVSPLMPEASPIDFFPAAGVLLENELEYFFTDKVPDRKARYTKDIGRWHRCNACRLVAVHHDSSSWASRPCGCYDGDHHLGNFDYDLEQVWRHTADPTRWVAAR